MRKPSDIEFRVATRVLREANRGKAADNVLRLELKQSRLAPEQSRTVSELVFAYYRWRGWLEAKQGLELQLRDAAKLVYKFTRTPQDFTDEELLTRAVPDWIWSQLPRSAEWARGL